MAKAQFHKNQRVYVRPVGTWALIERVVPHWTKGLQEPIRIFYDVGLGREFAADDLQSDQAQANGKSYKQEHETWRVVRARNQWQPAEGCSHHPEPGTYPVVTTGDSEWGGWRVPGAEYDLDPEKIERQARLIANAPRFAGMANRLVELARRTSEEMPVELVQIAREAQEALGSIEGVQAVSGNPN